MAKAPTLDPEKSRALGLALLPAEDLVGLVHPTACK